MSTQTPTFSPYKISSWYPKLANYTFPTSFVKLKPDEQQALKEQLTTGPVVDTIIKKLTPPMTFFPGNCFVFCDQGSPTDTERFDSKRGAVYSAKSAWRYLAESTKINSLCRQQTVDTICIRPFRRINRMREFRLFIHSRTLKAASQYWLVQHFKKLPKMQDSYWQLATDFVNEIAWLLPEDNIVIDIYITSDNSILIIDLNQWSNCDPLLLKDWHQDWSQPLGLRIINPPMTISGDVSVSF